MVKKAESVQILSAASHDAELVSVCSVHGIVIVNISLYWT